MSKKQKKTEAKPGLSVIDQMFLEEGVRPGADRDEIEKAKKVFEEKTDFTLLKKTEYLAMATASKQGRKRGPKPTASKNVTEDEERQRLETIRQLLGERGKILKKSDLLRAILGLLRIFKMRCASGIFLRQGERATVCGLVQDCSAGAALLAASIEAGDLAPHPRWDETPGVREIIDWLTGFEEDCWDNAVRQSWRAFESEVPFDSGEGTGSKSMRERELYNQIRIVLDLQTDLDEGRQSKRRETTESQIESTQTDLRSRAGAEHLHGLFPPVSVPQTLKAAYSALVMFRQIVDDCSYCKMNAGSENLYLLVHSLSLANPPGSLPVFVDKLETLFMTALARQRIHPFPILADEEMDFGAAEIPEDGQSRAF